MNNALNPSDLVRTYVVSADTVAAAADVDLATRIDVSDYEYALVTAVMGDGDTALSITTEFFAASTGGTATSSETALALSATDDNKYVQDEIRLHGKDQYLNFNVTGTGGTSSHLTLILQLFGPKQRQGVTTTPSSTPAAVDIALS